MRGVEATIDGWLTNKNGRWILQVPSSGEELRLEPLTTKIHWNTRTKQPQSAEPAELSAYQELLAHRSQEAAFARVVGPLTRTDPPSLQVREFQFFSPNKPTVLSITAAIVVNSPYGLSEPWVNLRQTLEKLPDLKWLADQPEAETSTVMLRTDDGRFPDWEKWARQIHASGEGARLRGIEVTVDGTVVQQGSRFYLRQDSGTGLLPLAPLSGKVHWDFRRNLPVPITRVEQTSWRRFCAEVNHRSPEIRVRVTGPLVRSIPGQQILLEVRSFQSLSNSGAPAAAAGAFAFVERPEVLFARRVGREVHLDWPDSEEPDNVLGYNLYASDTPHGSGWEKINEAPITATEFSLPICQENLQRYYAVTALDTSGAESAQSRPATPMPPAAPGPITVRIVSERAQLDWADNAEPDFDSYSIFRSQSADGPFVEIASVVLDSRYIDTGINTRGTYYYRVLAADHSGNQSQLSNVSSSRGR